MKRTGRIGTAACVLVLLGMFTVSGALAQQPMVIKMGQHLPARQPLLEDH